MICSLSASLLHWTPATGVENVVVFWSQLNAIVFVRFGCEIEEYIYRGQGELVLKLILKDIPG